MGFQYDRDWTFDRDRNVWFCTRTDSEGGVLQFTYKEFEEHPEQFEGAPPKRPEPVQVNRRRGARSRSRNKKPAQGNLDQYITSSSELQPSGGYMSGQETPSEHPRLLGSEIWNAHTRQEDHGGTESEAASVEGATTSTDTDYDDGKDQAFQDGNSDNDEAYSANSAGTDFGVESAGASTLGAALTHPYSMTTPSLGTDRSAKKVSKPSGQDPGTINRSNPMQVIAWEMKEAFHDNKVRTVLFYVRWYLPEYCKEILDGRFELRTVQTVTGTEGHAFASTCEEYVKQTWKDALPCNILRLVEKALGCDEVTASELSPSLRLRLELVNSMCKVEASGRTESLIVVAQQLAWLTASLRIRKAEHEGLVFSEVDFRRRGREEFIIQQKELKKIPESDRFYWHSFFPNSVIAHNFPIPTTNTSQGMMLPPLDTAMVSGRYGKLDMIADQIRLAYRNSKIGEVGFRIPWSFHQYCRDELAGESEPRLALTVTGTAEKAFAATCYDYLQWCWPNPSFKIFELIGKAQGQGPQLEFTSGNLFFSSSIDTGHIAPEIWTLRASGPLEALIVFGQQIAWLTACFRPGEEKRVMYSDITLSQCPDGMVEIRLLEAKPVPDEAQLCWHPMFSHYVIARGFPIPERDAERGIELAYQLMAAFGRTRYPQNYLDGIVLRGHSSILVPIWKTENTVQWHYIYNEDRRAEISLDCIKDHCEVVLDNANLNILKELRTFVGYSASVHVHLGTKGSGYNRVRAPPRNLARDTGRELLLGREFNPTLTIPGMGILGGSLAGKMVITKSKLIELVRDDELLDDQLLKAEKNTSILYDTDTKIGWMVSELSGILHMVHRWASRDEVCEKLAADLPFATLSGDGGKAACDAISKHKDDIIRFGPKEAENLTFGSRVKSTYLAMRSLKERLVKKQNESSKIHSPSRNPTLYGFNIDEIANLEDFITRLEVKIDASASGGWESIQRTNPQIMVLICHNLGAPIRPVSRDELCSSWEPIPPGRCLLVASVPCIVNLSRRLRADDGQSMLSPKHYCQKRYSLFEPCNFNSSTACERLQQLTNAPPKDPRHQLSFKLHGTHGAVIFGGNPLSRSSKKGCRRIEWELSGGNDEKNSNPSESSMDVGSTFNIASGQIDIPIELPDLPNGEGIAHPQVQPILDESSGGPASRVGPSERAQPSLMVATASQAAQPVATRSIRRVGHFRQLNAESSSSRGT